MFKNTIAKLISFTILPVAIFSIQRFSERQIGSTALWWLVEVVILLIFFLGWYNFFESENRKDVRVVTIFLLWMIFSIFRGFFVAETYWDWKGLVGNTFALLIPTVVYTASNKERLQSILSVFIKYVLPLAIPFLLPLPLGVWGWYLFPVSFLLLFLPAVKLQWRVLFILIAMLVSFGDVTVRSHAIKFGVSILLLVLYYFRVFIASKKIMVVIHKVLIFIPWVFFYLAVSGVFNVFNIKQYINEGFTEKISNDTGADEELITQDSRTPIYVEVIQSAKKHNYWIIGRSPARGNEIVTLFNLVSEVTGRNERLSNEAGIMNIFTWTGIVGVVLYFLVFYKASSLAINQSNNIYSKLIGLFVAFRWLYSWVEDDCSFSMNTITVWLMIGICFSKSFREMSNIEVKLWARGIFDKNYIKYMDYVKHHLPKTLTRLN